MWRATVCAALALVPAAVVLAQTPDDKFAFEVASVKPAAPLPPGMMITGQRGGPGTDDPAQVTFNNVTLRSLLTTAYHVQDYQISGPGWLATERYDIVAKVPKGATKAQYRVMLQNLLAERFHLTLHRETRQLPLYALVVARNGPKLKPAAPPAPADAASTPAGAPGAPPPGPPPGFPPPPGNGSMPPPKMDKDGFPQLPPGTARGGMIMMMVNGRTRMMSSALPISKLADALASQLGRAVTDKTGLTGEYEITLDFDPAGLGGMREFLPPPTPGGGPEGPGANQPELEATGLFAALQQQLGLKLEQTKGPLDLLLIDHAEKVPVEN